MSLTKEECLQSLCRIQCGAKQDKKCEDCDCFDNKINIWKCVENTKESLLIRQLINEHFDNTASFKRFKMYSDSTLKNMNKDELIEFIHILYHNWHAIDLYCNNAVKENNRLQNQAVEWSRVAKEKQERINELTSNPPLKFEELKENMWVWDNDYKLYCLIDRIYSFNKFSVNYHFNTMQEFEENRFYKFEVIDNG